MTRFVSLAPALVVVAVATAALSGCTATVPESAGSTPAPASVVEPVAESAPSQKDDEAEPDSCSGLSQVVSVSGGLYWERQGALRDRGAREFARGEVGFDDSGAPVTYTVEPGDVMAVIAERLCAYPTLDSLNHRRDVHPGQVLWLTPDPEVPWIPYYNPMEAGAGFEQIPYQRAIEAAGAAVDAGDVEGVRAVWNDTLEDMFTDPITISAVQEVVDSGDLDALRQVFS